MAKEQKYTNEIQPPFKVDNLDLEYFKSKLAREPNLEAQIKIRKQIELLEDAIVIYHEHRPND